MPYTEQDLAKLVADVEAEFTVHLAKAEEDLKSSLSKSDTSAADPLVKAEDEGDKKPEAKKPDEKAPEGDKKEEGEKAPEAKGTDKAPEGAPAPQGEKAPEGTEAAPPAPGEATAEGAPALGAEGDDSCDYDQADHEHMHTMYLSMSRGELKAHHDAVRKALDGKGLEKCGDMSMAKSEENVVVEIKPEVQSSQELELLKSEVTAEKAKTEALQKSLDAVSSFLSKLVEKKAAPAGKAITSLEAITKSEEIKENKVLTKSEVDAILNKKTAEPTLAKSDRQLINAYYLDGASINSISHLLK